MKLKDKAVLGVKVKMLLRLILNFFVSLSKHNDLWGKVVRKT